MAERGSRLRRTRDGWHKTSLGGHPLRIPELNGALTKTAAYRMTICAVEPFDYLIRKINDEDLPEVAQAKSARIRALEAIEALMTSRAQGYVFRWQIPTVTTLSGAGGNFNCSGRCSGAASTVGLRRRIFWPAKLS